MFKKVLMRASVRRCRGDGGALHTSAIIIHSDVAVPARCPSVLQVGRYVSSLLKMLLDIYSPQDLTELQTYSGRQYVWGYVGSYLQAQTGCQSTRGIF